MKISILSIFAITVLFSFNVIAENVIVGRFKAANLERVDGYRVNVLSLEVNDTATSTCTEITDTNFNLTESGKAYVKSPTFFDRTFFKSAFTSGGNDYLGLVGNEKISRTSTIKEVLPGIYEKGSCQEIVIDDQCEDIPRKNLMVALVMGQSNAADFGETLGSEFNGKFTNNVYAMRENGSCKRANDPLSWLNFHYGGYRSSVWSRLGQRIIDSGAYDNVLFVSIAFGGSKIESFLPGAVLVGISLNDMILDAIQKLKDRDFEITHILWHQGESDAIIEDIIPPLGFPLTYYSKTTTTSEYISRFKTLLQSIRDAGVDAPIYPAVATRCDDFPPESRIRDAQIELGTMADLGIYPGPDTDTIETDSFLRYDGCHMTDLGLDEHAELWLEKLLENKEE